MFLVYIFMYVCLRKLFLCTLQGIAINSQFWCTKDEKTQYWYNWTNKLEFTSWQWIRYKQIRRSAFYNLQKRNIKPVLELNDKLKRKTRKWVSKLNDYFAFQLLQHILLLLIILWKSHFNGNKLDSILK